MISCSNNYNNGEIIPSIHYLSYLLNEKESDCSNVKALKKMTLASLNYYINKYNLMNNVVLLAATFLNPIHKNFIFTESNEKANQLKQIAKDFLKNRHDGLNNHLKRQITNSNSSKNLSKTKETANLNYSEYIRSKLNFRSITINRYRIRAKRL